MQQTLVNLEHISSASLMEFAFSIYFAHLELINLSAVSKAWASSIHLAASLILPACLKKQKFKFDSLIINHACFTDSLFNIIIFLDLFK